MARSKAPLSGPSTWRKRHSSRAAGSGVLLPQPHSSRPPMGSPPNSLRLLGIRQQQRRNLPGRQRATLRRLRQLLRQQQHRRSGDSLPPADGAAD